MSVENLKVTDYDFLSKIYSESYKSREAIVSKKYSFDNTEYISLLEEQGMCIDKGGLPKEILNTIMNKAEVFFESGKNVSAGRDLSGLNDDNLKDFYKDYDKNKRLDEDLILSGYRNYEHLTDNVQIRNPFINIPEVLDIALNDRLVSIVQDYFGVAPSITYAKLVKNFANQLPNYNTQTYHIDLASTKIVKALIYLNDVGPGDGPHCYIKGSHNPEISKQIWDSAATFYADDVESTLLDRFNKDFVENAAIYGNLGDVIVEDTTGFHKGEKPVNKHRNILIINYGIHSEYGYNYKVDRKEKAIK